MTNEYGAALDRNGYAPSLLSKSPPRCFLCGCATGKLDRHEIYGGACRQKSKRLGLWVPLCRKCHEKAHKDRDVNLRLKRLGQRLAEATYDWTRDEFRREFGRNWLDDETEG